MREDDPLEVSCCRVGEQRDDVGSALRAAESERPRNCLARSRAQCKHENVVRGLAPRLESRDPVLGVDSNQGSVAEIRSSGANQPLERRALHLLSKKRLSDRERAVRELLLRSDDVDREELPGVSS